MPRSTVADFTLYRATDNRKPDTVTVIQFARLRSELKFITGRMEVDGARAP